MAAIVIVILSLYAPNYNFKNLFIKKNNLDSNQNPNNTIPNIENNFNGTSSDEYAIPQNSDTTNQLGCSESQISYALKNFRENSICNTFQNTICTEKTINCAIEVYNLDDNVEGIFKLKFTFFKDKEAFDYAYSEDKVGPKKFKTFEKTLTLTSSGDNGVANKNLSCAINTEGKCS